MGLKDKVNFLNPSLITAALSEVKTNYASLGAASKSNETHTYPLPPWLRPAALAVVTFCLAFIVVAMYKMWNYPCRPRKKGRGGGYPVLWNPNTSFTDGLVQWIFPLILPVGDMVRGDVEGIRGKVKFLSEMGWNSGVERLGLEVSEGSVVVGGKGKGKGKGKGLGGGGRLGTSRRDTRKRGRGGRREGKR